VSRPASSTGLPSGSTLGGIVIAMANYVAGHARIKKLRRRRQEVTVSSSRPLVSNHVVGTPLVRAPMMLHELAWRVATPPKRSIAAHCSVALIDGGAVVEKSERQRERENSGAHRGEVCDVHVRG
jgi:hypothetical protein